MGKFHRNFLFFLRLFFLTKKKLAAEPHSGPARSPDPIMYAGAVCGKIAPLGRAARAIEKIESAKKTLDNDWVVCYHAIVVSQY